MFQFIHTEYADMHHHHKHVLPCYMHLQLGSVSRYITQASDVIVCVVGPMQTWQSWSRTTVVEHCIQVSFTRFIENDVHLLHMSSERCHAWMRQSKRFSVRHRQACTCLHMYSGRLFVTDLGWCCARLCISISCCFIP